MSAAIVELEHGEAGVEATLEFWDEDPTRLAIHSDTRGIPPLGNNQPAVIADRTFAMPGDAADLEELASALSASVSAMSKKAVDPVPVLAMVLGSFVLGGIAQGFFGRIGEDLYLVLRRRLTSLVARRDHALVEFVLTATLHSRASVEVAIIAEITKDHSEPPEPFEVLAALEKELPRTIRKILDREPHRVVYSWEWHRLSLLHVLDRHGLPLIVRTIPKIEAAKQRSAESRRRGRHRRDNGPMAAVRCCAPRPRRVGRRGPPIGGGRPRIVGPRSERAGLRLAGRP